MPKMVANRDVRVPCLSGHVFMFEENIPLNVPRVAVAECQAVGVVLAPGETLEPLPGVSVESAPPGGAERLERIKEATRLIVARNSRDDFGASGRPTARAVDARCGFKTDTAERDTCWAALQYDNQQRREREAARRRKPSDLDELYEAIARVVDALVERGAEDDFTRDGEPHVKAIEEFLGYTITHEERNEVWKRYLARAEEGVDESTEATLPNAPADASPDPGKAEQGPKAKKKRSKRSPKSKAAPARAEA